VTMANRVKRLVSEHLNVPEDYVHPNSDFVNDLGADSLALVELLMLVEEKLGLNIPDEDAVQITSVGQLVTYAEAHA
jgi:acyl carrier protein